MMCSYSTASFSSKMNRVSPLTGKTIIPPSFCIKYHISVILGLKYFPHFNLSESICILSSMGCHSLFDNVFRVFFSVFQITIHLTVVRGFDLMR